MSKTFTNFLAQHRLVRALELKLEILEHGLAMPRDEYAIVQTKAMLKQTRLELEAGCGRLSPRRVPRATGRRSWNWLRMATARARSAKCSASIIQRLFVMVQMHHRTKNTTRIPTIISM
jgi:hypothetical protein